MDMVIRNCQGVNFMFELFGLFVFALVIIVRWVLESLIGFFVRLCLFESESIGLAGRIFPFFTYPLLSPCSHVPYVVHVIIYPIVFAMLLLLYSSHKFNLAPHFNVGLYIIFKTP